MHLSTAEIVKNSHIYTGSDFIFLNIALNKFPRLLLPNFNITYKIGKAVTK